MTRLRRSGSTSRALVLWKAKDAGEVIFMMGSIPDAAVQLPVVQYDDAALMQRQAQMERHLSFLRAPDFKVFSNGWLDREPERQ